MNIIHNFFNITDYFLIKIIISLPLRVKQGIKKVFKIMNLN